MDDLHRDVTRLYIRSWFQVFTKIEAAHDEPTSAPSSGGLAGGALPDVALFLAERVIGGIAGPPTVL